MARRRARAGPAWRLAAAAPARRCPASAAGASAAWLVAAAGAGGRAAAAVPLARRSPSALGILRLLRGDDGEPALWAPARPVAGLARGRVPLLRRAAGGACALVLGARCGLRSASRRRHCGSPRVARADPRPHARSRRSTGFVEVARRARRAARGSSSASRASGRSRRQALARRACASPIKTAHALAPGDFIAATARLLPPPEAGAARRLRFRPRRLLPRHRRGRLARRQDRGRRRRRRRRRRRCASPPPVDRARNALTHRIADADRRPGRRGRRRAGHRQARPDRRRDQRRSCARPASTTSSRSRACTWCWRPAWSSGSCGRCWRSSPPSRCTGRSRRSRPRRRDGRRDRLLRLLGLRRSRPSARSIMTLVMLGAILVDRPALSMRNLALAALIVLAREPEGLLGPSFQMSFGAVAGLIACARAARRQLSCRSARRAGRIGRAGRGAVVAAVVGTAGDDARGAGRDGALRHLPLPDASALRARRQRADPAARLPRGDAGGGARHPRLSRSASTRRSGG